MAPKRERTIDGEWTSGYQVKSKMDFLRLDLEVITLDNYFIIHVDCKTSPYFWVFKYERTVKQKVWSEAENREHETLTLR